MNPLGLIGALAMTASCTVGLASCDRMDAGEPAGEEGWLTGDAQQKFDTLANQHGGFSPTMVEVGYRYEELYWAGEDENWAFAAYQIEHIEEAFEAGLQRRPVRAESARDFLDQALPAVSAAVQQEDREAFREQMQTLSTHCNACHVKEEVPFVNVHVPTERRRPWGLQ